MEKEFAIKYEPFITEDMFNTLVLKLENEGYSSFRHYTDNNYQSFRDSQYFRTQCFGDGVPQRDKKGWCIDNNNQNLKEVSIYTIISSPKEQKVDDMDLKFKKGDSIQRKNDIDTYEITEIGKNIYKAYRLGNNSDLDTKSYIEDNFTLVEQEIPLNQLELEPWLERVEKLKLTERELLQEIGKAGYEEVYKKLEGNYAVGKAKLLYEKWNPEVVKEEKFPEYYEYTSNSHAFTKGKIYKIKNPQNLEEYSNFIDDNGKENGYSGENHKYFKPSTLETYNLQNSPKKEEEFIVGEWYKNYNNPIQYMKCSDFDDKYILGNEYIDGKLHRKGNFSWFKESPKLLTDLSEIQQYLPEGHIDKFVKKETMSNTSIPNCYIQLNSEEEYNQVSEFLENKGIKNNPSFIGNSFKNGDKTLIIDINYSGYYWMCNRAYDLEDISYLKPYGFNYIPKEEKSLVGRYLKALKDNPQYISILKKGDYTLITGNSTIEILKTCNNSKVWQWDKDNIGKDWELMPIGFMPDIPYEVKLPVVGEIFRVKGIDPYENEDYIEVTNKEQWSNTIRGNGNKTIWYKNDYIDCYDNSWESLIRRCKNKHFESYLKFSTKEAYLNQNSSTYNNIQKVESQPKVTIANTVIDIIAPSSNSVALGQIQKEVKININYSKTIKI